MVFRMARNCALFFRCREVVSFYIGPGAPLRSRLPVAEPDNVILLLCKQNSEYFVVDVRLKDNRQFANSADRLQHIQDSLKDGSLLDLLGNVECVDIVDFADLPQDMVFKADQLRSSFTALSSNTRPNSSKSSCSTNSFSSYLRPVRSFSRQSGNDTEEIPDDSMYEILCDAEWMQSREAQEMRATFENLVDSSRSGNPQSGRPATAISLMRLPSGNRPMLFIPKSRPATAEVAWLERGTPSDCFGIEPAFDKLETELASHQFFRCGSFGLNDEIEEVISRFDNSMAMYENPVRKATIPIKTERSKKINVIDSKKGATKTANQKPPALARKSPMDTRKIRLSSSHRIQKELNTNSENQLMEFITGRSDEAPKSRMQSRIAKKKPARSQCGKCQKRLGPAQIFTCKCNSIFCGQHRYSDKHACTFDYKADGKLRLEQENPRIQQDKVVRF